MKKKIILSAFALAIAIGCGKKENTPSTEVTTESTETTASTTQNWDFDKIDGSKLTFKNGENFDTHLFELSYIEQVSNGENAPFLIFSGKDCTECDAPISLYLHSPNNGNIDVSEGRNAYTNAGEIKDIETGALLGKVRVFYGEVLPNTIGMIWYSTNTENKQSIHLTKIENSNKSESDIKDKNTLDETLKLMKEGKCKEITSTK